MRMRKKKKMGPLFIWKVRGTNKKQCRQEEEFEKVHYLLLSSCLQALANSAVHN